MAMVRALVGVLFLQLVVAPAFATCGDNKIDPGEQCDGAVDFPCPGLCSEQCTCPPATTVDIPSAAQPPHTPGSPGVVVTNTKLLTQFGSGPFSLNNARYTRFRLDDSDAKPDAILILVPGFEGGANNFRILAQNLLVRARDDHGLTLEVWGVDRRTNQLEDTAGLDLAEQAVDPLLGANWAFGDELGLPLDPRLSRRAVFYNAQDDVPFMADWTNLVFSRDIDAIVDAALDRARNRNVFLGGHSAGTAFTARYAATDFDVTPSCDGTPEPGYAKLRGLVLLEGGGGSTGGGAALSDDSLDRMIAKFDGGLFGAVRDNAPRCVDGVTACTVASEATDCAGQEPAKCTLPTTAYALIPGVLNPRVFAVSETSAIQSLTDLNTDQIVTQKNIGADGKSLQDTVPDLAGLKVIPPATTEGSFGYFLNKNGVIAPALSFVAMSVGEPGPTVDGLLTWRDILDGPLGMGPDLGPPPTSLPAGRWGEDKEVTRLDRVLAAFYAGETNFADWYYPNAGPSTTSVTGKCSANVCVVGSVGASCTADAQCSQAINLDSTRLSAPPPLGRGRCDIENLTQAAKIDIPVIAFGGSAGLATVPGVYTPFAQSIGTCTAPSCDGSTPRVIDASSPNPAFPTFGDVAGGFEVYVNVGFAHLDVLTAEDNADNHVLGPLSDFLARNSVLTTCVGDCDEGGSVSVDELVRGTNIALGRAPLDQCMPFDCDGTGQVGVDCLVKGVSASLSGCSQ
jgi:pimeloyl-ACP methyl ester carboxylesterase